MTILLHYLGEWLVVVGCFVGFGLFLGIGVLADAISTRIAGPPVTGPRPDETWDRAADELVAGTGWEGTPDAGDALVWVLEGFAPDVAAGWAGLGAAAAADWRDAGFAPDEARDWLASGVSGPGSARAWLTMGCDPAAVRFWRLHLRADDDELRAWRATGLPPVLARVFRQSGHTPATVARLVPGYGPRRPFPSEEVSASVDEVDDRDDDDRDDEDWNEDDDG